jgi:hypothetical protein
VLGAGNGLSLQGQGSTKLRDPPLQAGSERRRGFLVPATLSLISMCARSSWTRNSSTCVRQWSNMDSRRA